MNHAKVVLDEDDMRRTLVRIAHEIVEKNAGEPVALVGIHRRGAHLATRLHRLVCDLLDADVPLGDIDIAFYRDDVATRPADPAVHASHLPFPLEDYTVVIVDDVLYTGRTVRAGDRGAVRLRAPRARPARRARRPRPPRAADPPRLRRQEPADRARRARQRPRDASSTASTRSRSSSSRRRWHEAPAVDRGPRPRGDRAHPGPRGVVRRGLRARDQEGPGAARPARAQPLLRGLHAHALELRAGRQGAERRRRELRRRRLGGREGRVAQGHGADAVRLPARRDRDPHAARRRRPAGRRAGPTPASSTPATASTSTRRRRCSTSTRCASGIGALDGANIWIVGDVLHSRVARSNILAFTEDGRERDRLRAADADPARHRGARLRGRVHARRARRGRRRLRAADAARADDRGLRAVAARVRRPLPDRRAPARRRARCSCTRARSTAASSWRPR